MSSPWRVPNEPHAAPGGAAGFIQRNEGGPSKRVCKVRI
jgi:hypothetical protein